MIVMRIKGGLGNQLFQYAAAYAISKRLGQPLEFDPSFTANMTNRQYKLPQLCVKSSDVVDIDKLPKAVLHLKNIYINKIFRILNISRYRCGNYLYLLEARDRLLPDFFTINDSNLYIDGYFQSEEYFKEYRKDLIAQLCPKYKPEKEYVEALNTICGCNSVAVHVRRSDFKKDNCSYHYLLDEEYYKRAISEMGKRLEFPVFFWFSDDMAWVKKHIGMSPDFRFIQMKTKHGDIDDMMLMKNCNHIITANSTFSWWAAWLNEKENVIRVVPQKPYGMNEMIPEGWIKV